jgi:hypothetical protein
MGVVGLSHNGQCIYSEDFCRQLMTEPDRNWSALLFRRIRVEPSAHPHSLALKTNRPMYALNPGLRFSTRRWPALLRRAAAPGRKPFVRQ